MNDPRSVALPRLRPALLLTALLIVPSALPISGVPRQALSQAAASGYRGLSAQSAAGSSGAASDPASPSLPLDSPTASATTTPTSPVAPSPTSVAATLTPASTPLVETLTTLASSGTTTITTPTITTPTITTPTITMPTVSATAGASALPTISPAPSTVVKSNAPSAHPATAGPGWTIRAVDTMKLSRDTLKDQLTDRQITAIVRQDARLHLTHVTADVYYDDPAYLSRWVRAIRAAGLHVWFRSHWYAWEDHRDRRGTMNPSAYIEATRTFLQNYSTLLANGDIFDFCPEPENGAYWLHTYGNGWSWHNAAAKTAFNTFIRSGLYMASTTLANRGRGAVLVTAVSVNASVATRLLSKPTVQRLGLLTLDLYPEGTTRDPAKATRLLLAEIASVYRHWHLPILLGEHGYARDFAADDATQARVVQAELAGLARLPYLRGVNYWVDAGGPGYGGYTNLFRLTGTTWQPRASAAVLANAYATMAPGHT